MLTYHERLQRLYPISILAGVDRYLRMLEARSTEKDGERQRIIAQREEIAEALELAGKRRRTKKNPGPLA